MIRTLVKEQTASHHTRRNFGGHPLSHLLASLGPHGAFSRSFAGAMRWCPHMRDMHWLSPAGSGFAAVMLNAVFCVGLIIWWASKR